MTRPIWVPGTPIPQGSKRLARGRILDANSRTLRPWRAHVTACTRTALEGAPPLAGPTRLDVIFHIPRPASHLKACGCLRAAAPALPASAPDLDKLVRAICDGLTDADAITDDRIITQIIATELYSTPLDQPGALIRLEPILVPHPTITCLRHQEHP